MARKYSNYRNYSRSQSKHNFYYGKTFWFMFLIVAFVFLWFLDQEKAYEVVHALSVLFSVLK